jgi:hypothetical protein
MCFALNVSKIPSELTRFGKSECLIEAHEPSRERLVLLPLSLESNIESNWTEW